MPESPRIPPFTGGSSQGVVTTPRKQGVFPERLNTASLRRQADLPLPLDEGAIRAGALRSRLQPIERGQRAAIVVAGVEANGVRIIGGLLDGEGVGVGSEGGHRLLGPGRGRGDRRDATACQTEQQHGCDERGRQDSFVRDATMPVRAHDEIHRMRATAGEATAKRSGRSRLED